MDYPSFLYKYRNWENDYNKIELLDSELYFTSALNFNDPFECKIPLNYEDESEEYIRKSIAYHIKERDKNISDADLHKEVDYWYNKKNWSNPDNIELMLAKLNSIGLYSLSSTYDNILMWSHYANSHRGFCISYDIKKLRQFFETEYFDNYNNLVNLVEVKYYEEFPNFLPSDLNSQQYYELPISSKAIDWEYEGEYRFYIMDHVNIKVKVPLNVIDSIYLGCQMPLEIKSKIKKYLLTREYKVKLFQSNRNKDAFKLNFKEIQY
ncbi:MAG: DUF2971 domain-containing protein [Calditrichaeota bacterium]|nr:MAG: DUF2971 domain-containing protein [Calditrichota bacterium]